MEGAEAVETYTPLCTAFSTPALVSRTVAERPTPQYSSVALVITP
jgi:hypothetical protein